MRVETTYLPAGDGAQAAAAGERLRGDAARSCRVRGEDAPPERTPIGEPGTKHAFQIGDVVEEHVQVVNPKDRNFVAVVVPLAAGMEPLNPASPPRRPRRSPTAS